MNPNSVVGDGKASFEGTETMILFLNLGFASLPGEPLLAIWLAGA
jgi:hypothetical protein